MNTKKWGFTLIELLVVISIISLLSSIMLAALSQTRMKARDTQRIRNLEEMQKALELYYTKYGYYPIKIGTAFVIAVSTPGNANWAGLQSALNGEGFLSTLTADPTNNGGVMVVSTGYAYRYQVSTDGQAYDLITRFETDNPLRCGVIPYTAHVTTTVTTAGVALCPSSNEAVFDYNHLYLVPH